MTASSTRIEALIVARAHTLQAPASANELLQPLGRFCPRELTQAAWRAELDAVTANLRGKALLPDHRLGEREALRRYIGPHHATTWPQLADRVLPALALGVAADDTKTLAKLSSRDAWAAAIVARARGQWQHGAPPSLAATCDAFAWQGLGLAGKPKRLPAEVRSLFLQRELSVAAAPPDRLVRQLAARELGVPRADARALREGLVRAWLSERPIGGGTGTAKQFADHVHAIARDVREGVFGERKVFISAVWGELHRDPAWTSLSLDEFKHRLVSAHHAGELLLARADLVAAMSPELVAASEIVTGGASFHFIVRDVP
jgi:hypothetical protein